MLKKKLLICFGIMLLCACSPENEDQKNPGKATADSANKAELVEPDESVKPVQLTKRDFSKTPEIWQEFEHKKATFDLVSITQKQFQSYVSKQPKKISATADVKPNASGLFTVKTEKFFYELRESESYSSSYQYIEFLPAVNAHLISFCGEGMCESFLLDNKTDLKMRVPANFDAGAIDLLVSPADNYLLVYSSYDGPDWKDYYSIRSEISVFKIGGNGIPGLKPFKLFESEEFSIDQIVWIDDKTVALKTYMENRPQNAEEFTYFMVKI